jgi:hypothetical protein
VARGAANTETKMVQMQLLAPAAEAMGWLGDYTLDIYYEAAGKRAPMLRAIFAFEPDA